MTEVEQKLDNAIREINRLMITLVDDVRDADEIRLCVVRLSDQLAKIVGRREIIGNRKNG